MTSHCAQHQGLLPQRTPLSYETICYCILQIAVFYCTYEVFCSYRNWKVNYERQRLLVFFCPHFLQHVSSELVYLCQNVWFKNCCLSCWLEFYRRLFSEFWVGIKTEFPTSEMAVQTPTLLHYIFLWWARLSMANYKIKMAANSEPYWCSTCFPGKDSAGISLFMFQ